MNINAVMVIVLFVALLSLFASISYAASVTICDPINRTITLPTAECKHYRIAGYKVRICP